MLSYRHSFHAGNHADVLKHIVQSLIITSLAEKEKPFLYLDTHSGAGRYLLTSEQAEKTAEYQEGILRLWHAAAIPQSLDPYLNCIKNYNQGKQLKYYPGSPLIAKQLMRGQDKLYLTEMHPTDFELLKQEFRQDKRCKVIRGDGFQQLKSQLPPVSRRGFVLIDPPYELKTDYDAVIKAIQDGYKRFATGVYAVWYPVVLRQQIKRMVQGFEQSGIKNILQIELAVKPDNEQRGMTASGMIVINPPWKLANQMQEILPWLHKTLVPCGNGHTLINWIAGE